MKPILEIQSISKKFNIHHEGEPYLNLRDRLTEMVKFKSSKKNDEDFWALKDVSFDVMPGEAIGIIGKNGAGKSTLLKILSKITPPTQGKIICRGKIASLLEVGTGFHPELTGRENIYLNGSILGMHKKEIDARFDEIVDFAGTEKFLDTPLKHYSSGMQLRLAFAVAAFLEPEILVIDEVLAVGDAEFQKKCLGKMEDVSKSGRTILFVSHNLAALKTLCPHSVILKKGEIDFIGQTTSAIGKYLSTNEGQGNNGIFDLGAHQNKKKSDRGITKSRLLKNGLVTDVFFSQEKFTAEFEFTDTSPLNEIVFGIVIKNDNQQPIIGINNWDLGIRLNKQPVTKGKIIFEIDALPLYGDSFYYIDLYFGDGGNNFDTIENAMRFRLQTTDVFHNGKILNPKLNIVYPGKIRMELYD